MFTSISYLLPVLFYDLPIALRFVPPFIPYLIYNVLSLCPIATFLSVVCFPLFAPTPQHLWSSLPGAGLWNSAPRLLPTVDFLQPFLCRCWLVSSPIFRLYHSRFFLWGIAWFMLASFLLPAVFLTELFPHHIHSSTGLLVWKHSPIKEKLGLFKTSLLSNMSES